MAKETKHNNNPKSKCSQVFTQVRIDEPTFLKGKILAAIYDESFNRLMIRAIRNEIRNYEEVNGPLPKPEPKGSEED